MCVVCTDRSGLVRNMLCHRRWYIKINTLHSNSFPNTPHERAGILGVLKWLVAVVVSAGSFSIGKGYKPNNGLMSNCL